MIGSKDLKMSLDIKSGTQSNCLAICGMLWFKIVQLSRHQLWNYDVMLIT